MAEITLKTRLLNKYDQSIAASEVLGKGEIHFEPVSIPVGSTGATETAVLMKVGDGSSTYENLKYVAARAADVYDWAKAADKPVYKANEIEGLSDYISGKIKDTNTTYTFAIVDGHLVVKSKDVDSETLTEVAKLDILTPDELANVLSDYVSNSAFDTFKESNTQAIADAKAAGTGAQAAAEAAQSKADSAYELAGKKATMAEVEAKGYATVDYVDGEVDTLEGAIAGKADKATTLAGYGITDAMTAEAIASAIATAKSEAITAATYNDTQVKADIKANADAIDAIEADYLKEEDKTALTQAINDEKARAEAAEAKALKDAKDYTDAELKGIAISVEKKEGIDYIVIKDNDNVEITSVNANAFVKDGMLTDADYNAETNKLTLTWNTDSGLTTTDIDLNDLVDTYIGGNGINVSTAGEISIDTAVVATVSALNEVKATAEAAQTAEEVGNAIDAKITALDLANTYEAKGAAATALSEAKSYADQAEADAVATAAADAKSKADAALEAAKAYADANDADTTYTAGTGLVLNGTVFSIDPNLVLILDAND